jgi:hypothetical protein
MDRVETTQKFELLFPMQAFDCFEAAGLELIHQLTVPNPWQDQTRLPGPLFLSRLSLFASERSVLYLGACRGRQFFDSLAFSADGTRLPHCRKALQKKSRPFRRRPTLKSVTDPSIGA